MIMCMCTGRYNNTYMYHHIDLNISYPPPVLLVHIH